MSLVTWEYTDGRLPPGRVVETSAQKLHLLLAEGRPIAIRAGEEEYLTFCRNHAHEPITAAAPDKIGPYEVVDAGEDEDEEEDEDAAGSLGHAPPEAGSEGGDASAQEHPAGAQAVRETAEAGDERDGWPDGYTYEQRHSYYEVIAPDGTNLGTRRGENAAQELAWGHANQNASSAEPVISGG